MLAFARLAAWFGYPEHDDEPSSSLGVPLDDFPVPPRQVSVVSPKNFEEAQKVADYFKRQHLVILNLWDVDTELSKRMVDFCAGLAYALGGQVQPVADRLVLLVPHDVEVLDKPGSEQLVERVFFNQL